MRECTDTHNSPVSQPSVPALHTTPAQPHRILVAGPDMAAAEATARLLTGHGHDARAVAGMADLLALAASFEPHLVILHIDPPTPSALEAARVLRHSKRGHLPAAAREADRTSGGVRRPGGGRDADPGL